MCSITTSRERIIPRICANLYKSGLCSRASYLLCDKEFLPARVGQAKTINVRTNALPSDPISHFPHLLLHPTLHAMEASARIVTLKEISLRNDKPDNKWREVRVDEENRGWHFTWREPIENQPVNLVYEEGTPFVLKIKVRWLFLFWSKVAELAVTKDVVSEALARQDGTYDHEVGEGRIGTMSLHFSTLGQDIDGFTPDAQSLDAESQRVVQDDRDGSGLTLPNLRLNVDGRSSTSAVFSAQSVPVDRKRSEGTQSDPGSLFDMESNGPESATTESHHLGQDIERQDPTQIKWRDSGFTEDLVDRAVDSTGLMRALRPRDQAKAIQDVVPEEFAAFDDVHRDANNILHEELDSSDGNACQGQPIAGTAEHETVKASLGETLIVRTSADVVEAAEGTKQDRGLARGNELNLEDQKEDQQGASFRTGHPKVEGEPGSYKRVDYANQLVERSSEMEQLRMTEVGRQDGRVLASRSAEILESPNAVLFPVNIAPPTIESPPGPEESTIELDTQAPTYQKSTPNASQVDITSKEGAINRQKSRFRLGFKRSITSAPGTKPVVAHSMSTPDKRDLDTVLNQLEQRLERRDAYLQVFLRFGLALSELHPIAKAAMASVVEIVKILRSQQKARKEVVELLNAMSRSLSIFDNVNRFDSTNHLKKAMERLRDNIFETLQYATKLLTPRKSKAHRFFRALIEEDRNQVNALKMDFEAFVTEYSRQVNVDTLLTVQDVHRGLQALHDRTQEHLDTEVLERVKAAYDHSYDMSRDLDGCMEGTRENVIKDILEWVDASGDLNILWLRSMPGAGKSAVARTLARRLNQESRHGGATFFFSRDDTGKRTPFVLWCHILYSLSCLLPPFKRSAADQLRRRHFELGGCNSNDMFNIVIGALSSLKDEDIPMEQTPVIIIDALDECPKYSSLATTPRQSVLDNLSKWSKLSSRFKIIVTSREDADISSVLDNEQTTRSVYLHTGIDVDERSSQDIHGFLKQQLSNRLRPSEGDLEGLSHRAAGLFIWATTALRFIFDPAGQPSNRFHRLVNNESPSQDSDELSKLYHLLLSEEFSANPDENVRLAFQRVIGSVVVALTPMTRGALVELLVGPGNRDDLTLESAEDVLRRITMLTSVRTSASQTIRFAHQSFPDFLVCPETQHQFYAIDPDKADRYLAIRCLDTLNANLRPNLCCLSFPPHSVSLPVAPSVIQEHIIPSLQYAAQSWAAHLTKCSPSQVLDLLQCLFDEHLLHWLEVMSLLSCLPKAVEMLRSAEAWLELHKGEIPSRHLARMAADAVLFASYFSQCIARSASHVYVSALTFSPRTSYIAQHYKKSSPTCLPVVLRGQPPNWPDTPTTPRIAPSRTLLSTLGLTNHGKIRDKTEQPTFKSVLPGSKSYVYCAIFTPDGKHVVTASGDRLVRVWDVATGESAEFAGHTARITSVAVSPDERYFASGSEDQSIQVRRLDTGELVGRPLTGHTKPVTSVAFSPDGICIVSGSSDKTLRIWNVASGMPVVDPLNGHTKPVTSVAVSRDGQLIASGSSDKSVCIWSLRTGDLIKNLNGHTDAILSVCFSADASQIASGSLDKTIRVWDTETGGAVRILEGHTHAVMSVAFSPDGSNIVSGSSDRSIRVWGTGNEPLLLEGHSDIVYAVAFSSDGRRIVSGSRDQSLRLWNVDRHTDRVTAVVYSADGKYVASGSRDGSVHVWNVGFEDIIQHLILDHVVGTTSLAFSPDGRFIASGYEDESVRVWSIDTGDVVLVKSPLHETPHDVSSISSVAFSSDSSSIICGTVDNRIHHWDVKPEYTKDHSIQLHNALTTVSSMTFFPDKQWAVTAGADSHSLHVYSTQTSEAVINFPKEHKDRITSLAVASDGKSILSGSVDGYVCVWDVEEIAMEQVFFVGRPVSSVALSLDGKHVAWGCENGQVSVWDLETDEKVCGPLEGHLEPVRSVAFSVDGRHLVSGSDDCSVRVWNLLVDDQTNDGDDCAWSLSDDGWATGTNGELLLYVPPVHRPNLYRPRNTFIFGEGATQLDLRELKHLTL